VVQSHLLQLLALTVMDLPKLDDWQSIPRLRCQALKSLRSTGKIVRGQYEGYKKEVKNEKSKTETFVSMQLESSDPSWQGVPIRLTTGKSLDVRTTEIRLSYKGEGNTEANLLTLHIQPHEGAEVCLWVKKPGYERQLQQIPLSFEYKQYFDYKLPDAYERVFVDAMHSDRTLFSTSEEVLASWEILAPVQEAWAKTTDDLKIYPKASAPQEIITA
jgi:glucose-6-phosphate 1-dehydrogenase